jgi:hypothetical protein
MKLITSGPDSPFNSAKDLLASADHEILVYSPYIRTEVLKKLLPSSTNASITVITKLTVADILAGASDLALFPFCESIGARMFVNNKLHLKAYIKDWQELITGSSNVTNRGLALTNGYNYELNTHAPILPPETAVYLKSIIFESMLMTEKAYQTFKQAVDQIPVQQEFEEPRVHYSPEPKRFLISQLPMSRSINEFYTIYNNGYESINEEYVDCALHDAAIYQVHPGLSNDEFRSHINRRFFESPFIVELLKFIDADDRYFGEVKIWIQDNCHDVPVPSRRTLTGNIQVLYHWISELSKGLYLVDRPRHSERIRRSEDT